MKLDHFFVTGDPLIYGADVSIALVSLGIIFVLTKYKKWKWLWTEWLTTVDHKKIGIMYILSAIIMMMRGGMDGMMMRLQLAFPDHPYLTEAHYDGIFSTHGTVMIIFMAMPFVFGMMNIAVPLQIGARDVAYPFLNALSFWLFFVGAMLYNIAFVIGGSPENGWTSYMPLAGPEFSPGIGDNYYAIAVQISGIGSLLTGINFLVTILKLRTPGMTLFKMPMFTWSVLITCIIMIFAFPVFTVALALMTIDRTFGTAFYTMAHQGMPMMWANLFWVWGHPEVYIVILPAFGIFSEIISTFSRKRLFGYHAMVYSMLAISVLSGLVWLHHFFTMGNSAAVNSFFSITTMAISIPTGVKIFNWLLTLYKGRIRFTTPMLWALAFIPNFVIGGITGVMLAMAAADYQYHNSYFLISHFHYTLIGGTVFAMFGGLIYWYPKMFGHMLNERLGKWVFWLWVIGFNVCFFPQYFLGLDGMTRRMYTYSDSLGWTGLNQLSTVGAFMMAAGFAVLAYNIYWSARYGERDLTGDPWDGRTLEWATQSPAQHYNFAALPEIKELDAYWYMKKRGESPVDVKNIKPIHMPSNTGLPFIMSAILGLTGFAMVWEWIPLAIVGIIAVFICMFIRSFTYNDGYHVSVDEINKTENIA